MSAQHEQIKAAMYAWQQEIMAGNLAFEHGRFQTANQRYESSLAWLLQAQTEIFGDNNPPVAWIADQYIPALVVSYLNIVDCTIAQHDAESACESLIEAHLQLHGCAFALAAKQTQPENYCLCEHISQLKQQTYSFAKRYAHRPELIAKLNHAMQVEPLADQLIH
ncbi:hypothetical protein ACFOEE_00445 [Pseudoalteromonas fenneropenaei]|uniref:Uncharacterized protein n=1 Tax=Pseudoalteromonas fenneropenaei TaxID=1737459 RepID=A0ABV7CD94_9GAMM